MTSPPSPPLFPDLASYVARREREFPRIDAERRALLEHASAWLRERVAAREPAPMTFICTHNSRRSHMGQIWAAVAAEHYAIANVRTYSGGTESTAFDPRAVASLRRAGLAITQTTTDTNPVYHVRMSDAAPPLTCFSKTYASAPNPKEGFAAIMTCADADEACPSVRGAAFRLAIPYLDPKVSDNTPRESETYDERCAQIAREMLWMLSRAR